jgi:hypothetical protein
MPENDKVITVVHEWVIKAENDLKAASHILKLGENVLRILSVFTPSSASGRLLVQPVGE